MANARIAVFPHRVRPGWAERLHAWLVPPRLSAQDLRKLWRRRLFVLFGGVVAIAATAAGSWWYVVSSRTISTDDAYVNASVADITPLVNGAVRDVRVHDTQSVKRGDVLVVIDPADVQIALAQSEANYAGALRRVRQVFANADAAQALVAARQADLKRAQLDYSRRAALATTGAVSGDELTMVKNALDTANAGLEAAKGQLAAQLALIQGRSVEDNPEVLAAKAALDAAKLALSRTIIRAPIDGIVAQRQVQIGQRVEVGMTLMTVVPISQVYVDANFKEGQLRKIHVGQPATLTSDLYGSGVVFHGRVVGVGGGTGSAFALIPAQNATGNWIKVVQRLPVRIALYPKELARHPLRLGLSMVASISADDEPASVKPGAALAAEKPAAKPAIQSQARVSSLKADEFVDPKPAVEDTGSDPVQPHEAAPPPTNAPRAQHEGFSLQIGAYKSQSEADAAWRLFTRRHSMAKLYRQTTREVDLGARGVWYRLKLGDFSDRNDAVALCGKLKADGGDCFLAGAR